MPDDTALLIENPKPNPSHVGPVPSEIPSLPKSPWSTSTGFSFGLIMVLLLTVGIAFYYFVA
jgi:hypothetical protein